MIKSTNGPRWKRYLSLRFLAGKVWEKGVVWCSRRAASIVYHRIGRASLLLVSILLRPIAFFLAAAKIRFLTSGNLLYRIGHLAREPEIYIKSGLVGWRPRYRGILLAPAESVVNRCLVHYWRRYITIVTHPVLTALLRPLAVTERLQYYTDRFTFPDGSTAHINPALYPIQSEYEAKYSDQSLLTLSRSDFEQGWYCLQKLGVPRDAWFVCLHVREGHYLPHLSYHSYRNADVCTYLLAVETIVERGGWVIRMGDPTMKPIPCMDQVIDYVHSEVRSDWMDVFCFATCRFYLGSPSGPFAISQVFGVPTVGTNWASMGHGPYSRRDIWIPKLYRSVSENRYLTFSEVLLSPLRGLYRTEDFDAAGVSLVDNSPEEIRDLAVEMMDRLDGTPRYTEEDECLQKRFKSLLEADPMYGTRARLGRDFLRKYAWLLPDETPQN